MKKIIVLVLMVCFSLGAYATPSYKLRSSVVGVSHSPATGIGYKLNSTAGQGYLGGVSSSSANNTKSGFWYQMNNTQPEIKSIEITAKTSNSFTVTAELNAGGRSANVRLLYGTTSGGPYTTLTFSGSPINSSADIELSATVNSLLISKKYFFKVKLETTSEGDLYSDEMSVWTNATTNSKSITFHSITKDRIGLRWTKGNGSGRVVVAKKGTAISSANNLLTDGTDYTISDVFGQGTAVDNGNAYLVYGGSNTTCLVNGLERNTTYHFKIFEYSGSLTENGSLSFLQTSTTGNPSSRATNKKDAEESNENYFDIVGVYPNPAVEYVMINLNVIESTPVDISLFDLYGNEIYSIKNQVYSKGLNPIKINTKDFLSGVYNISISQGNDLMVNTFVLEK